MRCPRCSKPLQPLSNGGGLYLRCEGEPPQCGVIIPATTAQTWITEKENEKPRHIPGVQRDTVVISPELQKDFDMVNERLGLS